MTAKSYGISVDNLIIGVGAALHYDNPEDAQSVELQQTIKDLGGNYRVVIARKE